MDKRQRSNIPGKGLEVPSAAMPEFYRLTPGKPGRVEKLIRIFHKLAQWLLDIVLAGAAAATKEWRDLINIHDLYYKNCSKRSRSEQDGTRLANTYRSTVTAFAAGCWSADYILPAACCTHVHEFSNVLTCQCHAINSRASVPCDPAGCLIN